ncbi:MAG: NAD-dependent epimerase/dehydratase family protein [Candidatus Paceibacterota bacterium]|jgi:UDP-glucose 4-epimerase
MKPETILVTGCAGFIGKNFVEQFNRRYPKTKIIGIDNLSTSYLPFKVPPYLKFYKGSICDEKTLDKIFSKHKPEYVFHFAALPRVAFSVEHPAITTLANVYGTVSLLEKSRDYKVKRVMVSSSSSVYGGAKSLPTKENTSSPDPKSPYALQKYVDEMFCKMFYDLYGLDSALLRYFNVFGPESYGSSPYSTVVSAWLENLYFPTGKKSYLEGDGKQTRDMCYVDNVIEANICAMLAPKKLAADIFNVGSAERFNLLEIKKLIEIKSSKQLDLEKRPPRLGDVRHTLADITKAEKILKYRPVVNFEDGLSKTVEWFKKRKI